ncbi:MAG: hypothetical protein LC797_03935 [Chloroflexi bacterium]|nr:hypothetical protein [Chloroflexota bacterium]
MIFFYELLFVLVAVLAVVIGEVWSRSAAFVFLGLCFVIVVLGYASFGARLATSEGLSEDDRRWLVDVRDGVRHLRLLFGLATLAALMWRLIAG